PGARPAHPRSAHDDRSVRLGRRVARRVRHRRQDVRRDRAARARVIGLRAPSSSALSDVRIAVVAAAAWASAAVVLLCGPRTGGSLLTVVVAGLVTAAVALARSASPAAHDLVWTVVAVVVATTAVGGVATLRAVSIRPPVVAGLTAGHVRSAVELVVT